jgi:hypothetical protein
MPSPRQVKTLVFEKTFEHFGLFRLATVADDKAKRAKLHFGVRHRGIIANCLCSKIELRKGNQSDTNLTQRCTTWLQCCSNFIATHRSDYIVSSSQMSCFCNVYPTRYFRLTSWRSLVQVQYRPLDKVLTRNGLGLFLFSDEFSLSSFLLSALNSLFISA